MSTAKVTFLIRLKVPYSLYRSIPKDKKSYLDNLAREKYAKVNEMEFVFEAGDMLRVKRVFDEANIPIEFPKAKTIRQWGLAYSSKGDSIEIHRQDDAFVVISQKLGEEPEMYVIPEKRVWRVFYTIKRVIEQADGDVVGSREVWGELIKEFQMLNFLKATGEPNTDAFFGNRKTYYNFFYYPVKILQEIGKIEYSKSGKIRLKEAK